MGNFSYLCTSDNKAASATIYSVSSEDSAYPSSNAKVLPISKCWRTTGKTSENIVLDLGSAQAISLVALVNHNLTSGATITLAAGTTTACTDYSTTITWRQYDAFKFITQTYRYWKITMADSGNSFAYLSVGYIMLGSITTMSGNYAYGWTQKFDHQNYVFESEMGVPYVARLFKRNVLKFDWVNATSTTIAQVKAMVDKAERNVSPCFILPDVNGSEGYFVLFADDPTIVTDKNAYSASIECIEVSRGRSTGA